MRAARWTADQLGEQLSKNPGIAVAAGVGHQAVTVPKGPKLSKETLEGVREYLFQIRLAGIPLPVLEFRFHDKRRWHSDFAWPDEMLLAEYEGGVYTGGRHTRGKGFEDDCKKYNEAALLGYRVLRFTYDMVRSGMALAMTERALHQ